MKRLFVGFAIAVLVVPVLAQAGVVALPIYSLGNSGPAHYWAIQSKLNEPVFVQSIDSDMAVHSAEYDGDAMQITGNTIVISRTLPARASRYLHVTYDDNQPNLTVNYQLVSTPTPVPTNTPAPAPTQAPVGQSYTIYLPVIIR